MLQHAQMVVHNHNQTQAWNNDVIGSSTFRINVTMCKLWCAIDRHHAYITCTVSYKDQVFAQIMAGPEFELVALELCYDHVLSKDQVLVRNNQTGLSTQLILVSSSLLLLHIIITLRSLTLESSFIHTHSTVLQWEIIYRLTSFIGAPYCSVFKHLPSPHLLLLSVGCYCRVGGKNFITQSHGMCGYLPSNTPSPFVKVGIHSKCGYWYTTWSSYNWIKITRTTCCWAEDECLCSCTWTARITRDWWENTSFFNPNTW